MKFPIIACLLTALLFALTGCATVNTPAVTLGSELATIAIIGHQPPEKQKATAQIAYTVADGISKATQDNPDLSSIKAVTRPLIAKEVAKLAPTDGLVIQLILNVSLDSADVVYAQAISAGAATDKGKAAQEIVQAVTAGIRAGALIVLNPTPSGPPATQPN